MQESEYPRRVDCIPKPSSRLSLLNHRQKNVSIYNVIGQLWKRDVSTKWNSEQFIDISDLADGIYFLMINNKVLRFMKYWLFLRKIEFSQRQTIQTWQFQVFILSVSVGNFWKPQLVDFQWVWNKKQKFLSLRWVQFATVRKVCKSLIYTLFLFCTIRKCSRFYANWVSFWWPLFKNQKGVNGVRTNTNIIGLKINKISLI